MSNHTKIQNCYVNNTRGTVPHLPERGRLWFQKKSDTTLEKNHLLCCTHIKSPMKWRDQCNLYSTKRQLRPARRTPPTFCFPLNPFSREADLSWPKKSTGQAGKAPNYTQTHTDTHTHTDIHTQRHTHTHKDTHRHTHTHTDTHTHRYTHTHTATCGPALSQKNTGSLELILAWLLLLPRRTFHKRTQVLVLAPSYSVNLGKTTLSFSFPFTKARISICM